MPKSSIKTNERELAGKVAEWFNSVIQQRKYPFTDATNEPGVKIDKKTRFGDIVLWRNREAKDAFSYIELKPPFAASENLETFRQKALELSVRYAYTWDFQTLNAYEIKDHEVSHIGSETTPVLYQLNDWLRGDVQVTIRKYVDRICDELVRLHDTGTFTKFSPEKVYFINFVRSTKEKLSPKYESFIKEASRSKTKRDKISAYCARQGIAKPTEEFKQLAEQAVYGLITKIIFYLTIQRYFKQLPDLYESNDDDLGQRISNAFAKAREIDWQAVFENDPIEELGIPEDTFDDLREFFGELRAYHFGELPEDVIGELFEEIIDPDQRHSLGQYFTREDLVDLIIGTVVHEPKGIYGDPTCGSGTFLVRLYDRLRYLSNPPAEHRELLNQIWGFDSGKFPAELSTINLFRQEADDFENFPRIQCTDIFDVFSGKTFDYPPAEQGKYSNKVPLAVPPFDGLVGNFPFIRQELIEKNVKGYKSFLTKTLAKNYLSTYPALFDTKPNVPIVPNNEKSLEDAVQKKFLQLKLSGQADIYAYIYLHTATFLKSNGAMAIITSNSWLDVAYGSVLKEFFLDHFKIKMIVASWAEPWFEDAAVNTVFTVLEKEVNPEKRAANKIRFVKLKKKLTELIPFTDLKLESQKRWRRIDGIVSMIESAEHQKNARSVTNTIASFENDDMRVRMIPQKFIQEELSQKGDLDKWGKYLRAPDVYFEILEKCKDKLVPLKQIADVRFGIKTGVNEFFYLEVVKRSGALFDCKNDRGWEGKIESKYLRQVIKSPKEADSIVIDPDKMKYSIFICDKSKSELKKLGDTYALKYIEWGEKQKTEDGVSWPDVPSVSGRKNWWGLLNVNTAKGILSCGIRETYKVFENDNSQVLADKRMYEIYTENDYVIPILNSFLMHLYSESDTRELGDGFIDLTVYEVEQTPIPRKELLNNKIITAFQKIRKRQIKNILEEYKQKDRIVLDTAVLETLDLDPKEYLPRIYDGLCEMVRDRLELSKMRKSQKKQTVKVSYDAIKASVIADCLADGVKQFPKDFYHPDLKDKKLPFDYDALEFESFPVTGRPLHYKEFFGRFEIEDSDGKKIHESDSEEKAKFVCLLAKPDIFRIKVPVNNKIVKKLLHDYHQYIKNLRDQLIKDAGSKLHDWNLAERMAKEILVEYGVVAN
ncbi:SAM-dependent DNA methyltransferase [bacterium]|nr:SAM-dependent DNA methyltransferase [bacterium]